MERFKDQLNHKISLNIEIRFKHSFSIKTEKSLVEIKQITDNYVAEIPQGQNEH